MRDLAAFLFVVSLLLLALVIVVRAADPPEPVLLVDAAAPSNGNPYDFELRFITGAELCPEIPQREGRISHT